MLCCLNNDTNTHAYCTNMYVDKFIHSAELFSKKAIAAVAGD